ncbi:MAG: ATP-binding protein [candidate division KSB1 bacterium]
MEKELQTKIMIVEDEAIVAFDIQSRLLKLGYAVTEAFSTGEEALNKVADNSPDLILMDIMLAGAMNGIETAEQIRVRFDIPVIFLTAYADEKTLQAAKLTAPYGYVLKPFEERELHSSIEMGLYRHKLEREIKESRQWFATMLKCIGDAVIATNNSGKVAFMNTVAETLTGWREAEAHGRNLAEIFNIVNETTRAPVDNPALRALREGVITALANHTILIAKDGTERPIDDSAAPIIDERGNIIGVVLVFRDVTERKHAEDLIRSQNERLEEQVRLRTARIQQLERERTENEKLAAAGRMAARIAHEINNPLAGIKNSFLLIKKIVPREHPHYEFVPRVEREIDRITAIVHQMFNLHRPDRNTTNAFPAGEAMRDVVAMVRASATEQGVHVVHDASQVTNIKVKSEGVFRQVLYNLIRNAIEASPPGAEVKVTAQVENDLLRVFVVDHGDGIPEHLHTQIFEPFFTTKSGTTTGGLGLGLSISKSLVEASGGTLSLQSQMHEGTTFSFSLPLIASNGGNA